MDVATLKIVIDAQNNANAQLKEVSGSAEGTGLSFGKMAGAMALGNLAATAVTKGMELLKGGFDEAKKAAESMAASNSQINALLASTHSASGQTSESINKMAESISKTTPISKEAALSAATMLLPFTHIGKDVFPGVMNAADDLATHLNHGLAPNSDQVAAAAQKLGIAFEDPEKSFGRLKKAGVDLTAQQQEQIKKMQDSGNTVGAQKLLLEALSNTMGGSAVAAGKTFQGMMTEAKNRVVDFGASLITGGENKLAQLGTSLAKFVQSDKFQAWMKSAQETISKLAQIVGNVLGPPLKELFNTIMTQLVPAIEKYWKAIEPILIPALKVLAVIVGVILLVAIRAIIDILIIAVKILADFYNVIAAVITWLARAVAAVINFGQSVVHWFSTLRSAVGNALGDVGSWLYDTGKNIITGLINGLKNMAGQAADAVKNVAKGITDAAKKVLKIFSPSAVFHDIGQNIGQGMITGMASMQDAVSGAAGGLAGVTINGAATANSTSMPSNMTSTSNTTKTTAINNPTFYLGTQSAVKEFFVQIDQDTINLNKGLTPARGQS